MNEIQIGFKSAVKALKAAGIPMKRGKGRGVLAVWPGTLRLVPAMEAYEFFGLTQRSAKPRRKRLLQTSKSATRHAPKAKASIQPQTKRRRRRSAKSPAK